MDSENKEVGNDANACHCCHVLCRLRARAACGDRAGQTSPAAGPLSEAHSALEDKEAIHGLMMTYAAR